jgi:hypothetical protein
MNRILLILCFVFYSIFGYAQLTIEGTVFDLASKQTMPFVNVISYKNKVVTGDVTDVEGKFKLELKDKPDSIVFSFIGYAKKTYINTYPKWVYLEVSETTLNAVDVKAGINPALRIIKNTLDRIKENDVKYTHSYTHDSYTLFRADIDQKELPVLDSLTDTLSQEIVKFFSKREAFRMETYSEVRYKPVNNKKEVVTATKTAGLENPMFAAIATQIQAFSAYDNPLVLFGTSYLNPISKGGYSGYYFILQDTLFEGRDSVFIIDFHPRKGKDFKGLKGKIFIHSENWAIENVMYELPSLFGIAGSTKNPITIAMSYEKMNDTTWFPKEAKTIIPISFVSVSDSVSASSDSSGSRRLKGFVVSNTSTFKNVKLDPEKAELKTGGAPVQVEDNANKRSEEDWIVMRGDSLSAREQETYHYVDSVSQSLKLEKKLDGLQQLLKGNIRIKWFDLSLLDIINFNNFEGFRFGLGGTTNERLIPWLSIGAYGAYGLKDKRFKYGGDLNFHIIRAQHFNFHAYYHDDVKSTGYNDPVDPGGMFNQSEVLRNVYVNKMDYQQNLAFELESYVYKNIFLRVFNHNKRIWTGYDYNFDDPNQISDGNYFKVVETGVSLNWKIANKYIQLPYDRLYTEQPRFPEINATIVKGWNNSWFGQYNYVRAQFRIDQRFRFLKLGSIFLQGEWNKVWGDVPVPLLLYTPGTFDRFGITTPNNLETVRPSEFLNSQTVVGHFRLEFNPFKSKKGKGKYAPILALRFSAAWGNLEHPERQQIVSFSTMQKGYYEAGFVFDNLLNIRIIGLGIGFFQRFGPYNYPKEWDNMAIKLSIRIKMFTQ